MSPVDSQKSLQQSNSGTNLSSYPAIPTNNQSNPPPAYSSYANNNTNPPYSLNNPNGQYVTSTGPPAYGTVTSTYAAQLVTPNYNSTFATQPLSNPPLGNTYITQQQYPTLKTTTWRFGRPKRHALRGR